MIEWLSTIYKTFIIVGIIILLCTVWTNTSSSLTGSIVGYSFLIVGILLVLSELLKKKYYSQTSISVMYIVTTLLPVLILLGSLIYMISMISIHFDRISQDHISGSYYSFMVIFILLLFGILVLFYRGMHNKEFEATQTLNKVTALFIYLVEIIYVVIIITLGIIF